MLDEERLAYFCHHNWWNLTTKYQTEQILWSTSGCKFVLDLRYVSLPLNSWHVTSEAPRRYFYAFLRTISNMPPEPSAFMLLAFWYGRECYMRCTTESLIKACSRLRQDAGSRYPEKAFLGGPPYCTEILHAFWRMRHQFYAKITPKILSNTGIG